MRLTRPGVAGLVLALVVAACGGGAAETTTTTATETTTTTTTAATSTTTAETTTTTGTPSTSTETTTTTVATTTTTTLAGEEIDFGPRKGDVLAVMGVRWDDVLNVRAGPGTDQPIVATLAPTSNEAVATGHTRMLPRSFWTEVTVGGVTGWASLAYLGYLGRAEDLTADVVAALGGVPTAGTIHDLGMLVAQSQASTEPRSDLVVVVAPTTGDTAEITIDVVGLGDDALAGLRLRVVGERASDGGYSLVSVQATLLCGRGVTDDGRCL